MQGRHRAAQFRCRVAQRRVHRLQHRIRLSFKNFLDFQTCRQQILQRAVMQPLGDFAVVPLLGAHRFQHQLLACVQKLLDVFGAALEDEAHSGGRSGQPQQCHNGEVLVAGNTVDVATPGVEHQNTQIPCSGDGSEDSRHSRTLLKGHRNGKQEEHREQFRRAVTGGHTQRHHGGDVHGGGGRGHPHRDMSTNRDQHPHNRRHRVHGQHPVIHTDMPHFDVRVRPQQHNQHDQGQP